MELVEVSNETLGLAGTEESLCIGHCPSWFQCLIPIAPVWLVLQEEIQPSVSFLDAGSKMLLAGLLWTGFGLCVSMIQFLYQHRRLKQEVFSQNHKFAVRMTDQDQHACHISQQNARFVATLNALLDGMVVSLVQEQLSDPSLSQIRSLLSRLEGVSQAFHNGMLSEGQLLQANDGMDRVRQVCTYLQERISVLRSLIQVQNKYGTCMADVQQRLQELWELLESLHTNITLQPEKLFEDTQTVLSNTESLYSQLEMFQSKIQECHSYLSTSTHLLQELESSQQILAQTVGLTLESMWIKEILQCNTQQFEKVHTNLTSLEQQTLTFVMNLHDLGRSQGESGIFASDVEHTQTSSLSPISSLPVYSIATKSPIWEPKPECPPKANWKLAALWSLCGARKKK